MLNDWAGDFGATGVSKSIICLKAGGACISVLEGNAGILVELSDFYFWLNSWGVEQGDCCISTIWEMFATC
jgi:hypothetical protein